MDILFECVFREKDKRINLLWWQKPLSHLEGCWCLWWWTVVIHCQIHISLSFHKHMPGALEGKERVLSSTAEEVMAHLTIEQELLYHWAAKGRPFPPSDRRWCRKNDFQVNITSEYKRPERHQAGSSLGNYFNAQKFLVRWGFMMHHEACVTQSCLWALRIF